MGIKKSEAILTIRSCPNYLLQMMPRKLNIPKKYLNSLLNYFCGRYDMAHDFAWDARESGEHKNAWIWTIEKKVCGQLATELTILGSGVEKDFVSVAFRMIEAYFLPGYVEQELDAMSYIDDLAEYREAKAIQYLGQLMEEYPEYESAEEEIRPYLDAYYDLEKQGFQPSFMEVLSIDDDYYEQVRAFYKEITGHELLTCEEDLIH